MGENERIIVSNESELISASDDVDGYRARLNHKKIALLNQPKDLFAIHKIFNNSYVISKSLKLALDAINATGIKSLEEVIINFAE